MLYFYIIIITINNSIKFDHFWGIIISVLFIFTCE